MIQHRRPRKAQLSFLGVFVFCCACAAAQAVAPRLTVEALLQDLRKQGLEVIYSSDLVPPDLAGPPPRADVSPLQRAQEALAANGLALRAVGPNTYVVVRAPAPARDSAADANRPLEEISVYASRYAINGALAEPRKLSSTDIQMVPGSHDDALHALHSLPGLASNVSARPYIRGSLTEDVLFRYDGITLLDPFHLKNFQSLISAIDPAAVERIEVFSGGFPVQYGTRSGGVIDVTAPSYDAGNEYRANLSLISGSVSSIGKSERWPIEWLAAIRRSTLDLLEPVEDGFGQPQFSDSVGRVRWITENGAWTAGWLLLDDALKLGQSDDEEKATAEYRDEYVWLARDHRFSDVLQTRASIVITSAERTRAGSMLNPGVASGVLDEEQNFNGLEFSNDWTLASSDRSIYTFGGGLATTQADYQYVRHSEFAPGIAAAFGRPTIEDTQFTARPEVVTYALYAANRRKWDHLEMELGLRLDGQHFEVGGDHSQLSPRLNLRYDLGERLRLYGSAGRFTQAQHVEEWRAEEGQQLPDPAQVSTHTVLGLEYETPGATRLSIEAYTKRWSTAAPYFDNILDPLALLPELAPDRVRLAPRRSEASGLEFSARSSLSDQLTAWGTLTVSRVEDDADVNEVSRSWDQPLSLNAGLSWNGTRASVSMLAGWHSGWPRTAVELTPVTGGATTTLALGPRNADRWGDFYSLDFRGSWTWTYASGDLSAVLDVTNSTNRHNPCCFVLETSQTTQALQTDVDHWLPLIVNLGFTFRWRNSP